MNDYGALRYYYVHHQGTMESKYCFTLVWSKISNCIKCTLWKYNYKECEYFVSHRYIDAEYSKADVSTAKTFFEILIRSFPSD